MKIASDGALINKNGATLNITGGTNTNKINGNGTTNINADMTNNGSIEQGSINVASGTNLVNNGNITSASSFQNKENSKITNTENATFTAAGLDNDSYIFNDGTIYLTEGTSDNSGSITGSGTFNNSSNLTNTGIIKQDAIVNNGTITTNANNFGLNDTTDPSKSIVNNDGAKITFNGGIVNSNISGSGSTVFDSPEQVAINSKISGNNVSFNNGELFFGQNADLSQANSFAINGGTMNLMDNQAKQLDLGNNVTLNGNTELAIDFNLDTMTSDSFTTRPQVTNDAKFHISKDHFNLVGNNVNNNVTVDLGETTNVGHENLTTDTFNLPAVMTPIRKIGGRVEDGYLTYGPTGNSYSDFNPAVMASSVAAQGGYMSQLNSYEEAFKNLDSRMLMTQEERKSLKLANSYASANGPQTFSEIYLPEKDNAIWSRSYATFEKVNLDNGPKVNNTMYGSYYGGDSRMKEFGDGYEVQFSGYAGYNGANQSFDGVHINQNGANVGATAMLYKDSFFAAATANVGVGVADASTMYGSEDVPMIMTGVAAKTGYNFEFNKGTVIVQPSLLASYTNVNTKDHKNPAGVEIDGKALNAIQLAPELKVIGNFKNGWQPYASVRMVWNLLDDSEFSASDVKLPDAHIDPYVQYGLGVQKRWGEVFTGYAEAMARSGGRNGVALNAGFRWALGKYDHPEYNNSIESVVENATEPTINTQVTRQVNNLNVNNVINTGSNVKKVPQQTVVVPTANVQPVKQTSQAAPYVFRAPIQQPSLSNTLNNNQTSYKNNMNHLANGSKPQLDETTRTTKNASVDKI